MNVREEMCFMHEENSTLTLFFVVCAERSTSIDQQCTHRISRYENNLTDFLPIPHVKCRLACKKVVHRLKAGKRLVSYILLVKLIRV